MTNPAAALAALSATAQSVQDLGAFAPSTWLSLLSAGLLVLMGPFLNQDLSEIIIASLGVPAFAKPFVSRAIASAVGGLMAKSGVDAATATAVASYLWVGAEKVNASPWALELESKMPTLWTWIKKIFQKPGAPAASLLLLALLSVAGMAHADGTPTASANGFIATPSLGLQSGMYAIQSDMSLTPTAESAVEGQYGLYFGTWTVDAAGNLSYAPLVYLVAGIGMDAGVGETRGVASVSLGYTYFGVSVTKNVGDGLPPLVALQTNWTFTGLVHPLVWDLSGARKEFPTATW